MIPGGPMGLKSGYNLRMVIFSGFYQEFTERLGEQ